MTTRKEKRMKRQRLIQNLQRLEIQHQLVNGPDFILSQCKGCDICTQIRAIGEELSPSNQDVCTQAGLTIESYKDMKNQGMSDKEIATELMVHPTTVKNWKAKFDIQTRRKKRYQPKRCEITGELSKTIGRPSLISMTKKQYVEMCEQGMTTMDIAELLNCSRPTLYRWRKQNDLKDVRAGKTWAT